MDTEKKTSFPYLSIKKNKLTFTFAEILQIFSS